ncbi:MAG: DUF2334 domain-containing protein [Caulobacteraceae bacterium]|nr:DUF2334 domain-containing protein [Caulobacteraceae bacterium]
MKLNISIDDVTPHPFSSTKVLDNCAPIIEAFPDVKISLFVPVAYWRTTRPGIATPHPLMIDKFPEFCNKIRSLPAETFEVCMHGFYHGIPGKSDNDEFQYLTYQEALDKFSQISEVITNSGLTDVFKPVFRPPAWRMSPDAIRAAKDFGIRTLALSPKEYAKSTYAKSDDTFGNVVYYTCNPPFDPLSHFEKNEIVYHACEWDKNYLSKDLASQLITWIDRQRVQFCFIEELL